MVSQTTQSNTIFFLSVEIVQRFSSIFSLNELVVDGRNGFVFNNVKELGEQLTNWFYGFPSNMALVAMKDEFAKNLIKFQRLRWKDNWNTVVLPRL